MKRERENLKAMKDHEEALGERARNKHDQPELGMEQQAGKSMPGSCADARRWKQSLRARGRGGGDSLKGCD